MVGQLNCRILLVDDDPLVRRVITGYLVAAGHVVKVAVDGLDALEKLRGGIPDLIISDLLMPRMSGAELIAIVHRRFPQIPVIVITGGFDAPDLHEQVAADAYYHKNGGGFDDLVQTVAELTRRPTVRVPVPEPDPIQAISDGNGHYTIQCEYCFRPFSVPRSPVGPDRCEHRATCIHCRGAVKFIAEERDLQVPA